MRRTVQVTITKTVEVVIPDHMLTPEATRHFCSYMFQVDTPEDLFKYAAAQYAQHDDTFVEGLGMAITGVKLNPPSDFLMCEVKEADTECEVLP
jgi:hypothetical protein